MNPFKIYVDMDGVLCAFRRQAAKLFDVSAEEVDKYFKEHPKKSWFKIEKAGEAFWEKMDWMGDGEQLWKAISIHRPTLLSSPANHPSCHIGKNAWVGKNIGDAPLILESEKQKYAKHKNCILIDDKEENIDKWNKAGGTGVLHKNTRDTLKELQSILSTEEELSEKESNLVVASLDRIASILEEKGLRSQAKKIDIIANTLEKLSGKNPVGEKGDTKKTSRPNPVFDHTDPDVLDDADHFPIDTEKRARAALSYANQYDSSPSWYKGSLEDLKKKVADAVKRAYSGIKVLEESYE